MQNESEIKKGDIDKKTDFWNFLTDFRFYIAVIVLIIWILSEFGLIFNHQK